MFLSTFVLADNTQYGIALPGDAVSYDQQVLRVPCDNTRNEVTFDFAVSVYQRYECIADLFQDTVIWKPPNSQERVEWHQDYSYWPLDKPDGITIWISLTHASKQNGCLSFLNRCIFSIKSKILTHPHVF